MLIRDHVVVPPEVSAVFALGLRDQLRKLARDGFPVADLAWTALDEIERVAAAVREQQAVRAARERGDVATGVVASVVTPLSSAKVVPVTNEVSPREAAQLTGVSKAAITARCRRGTLPSRLDERGRRWISREALGA